MSRCFSKIHKGIISKRYTDSIKVSEGYGERNMNKWTHETVEAWVDAHMNDMIRDLIRIVNIRSVAELEHPQVKPFGKGCRDVLEEMLLMGKKEGFSIENYDGYVGCISLNDRKKDIGIWAHLDVVEEGDGWQYEPYQACVKDGYVIGRGANDNKSSAIMGLYLLKFFKENKITLSHNIRLYLGTCEEKGMLDLDYFVQHYPCPEISLVPDSGFPVCCGERGSFNGVIRSDEKLSEDVIEFYTSDRLYMIPETATICLKYSEERMKRCGGLPKEITVDRTKKGICLTAHGIASNAAQPQKCVNAMEILLHAVHAYRLLSEKDDKILSICRKINEDYQGRALNVYCEDEQSGPIILAATVAKMRDHHLEISFISKFPVTKNGMDFPKLAKKACEDYGMKLQVTRYEKANYFDPSHPLARIMTNTYNTYMEDSQAPFVMSGGTYARKLPNAFACGTGMKIKNKSKSPFLPGHGDYHQPDEGILVERIRKALVIYILGMLNYCA